LDARESLVHIHRVQERLVETRLVLLRHQQDLVLLRRELLWQLLLSNAEIHLLLGVFDARELVVQDRA
jgi:hypothetical protein